MLLSKQRAILSRLPVATNNSAKGSDILGICQPFFGDFDSHRNTLRVSSGLFKSSGSVYVGAEPEHVNSHLKTPEWYNFKKITSTFLCFRETKPVSAAWGYYKGGLAYVFKALKASQGKVPCNSQA